MGNVQQSNISCDSRQIQLPPLSQIQENLKTFFQNIPNKIERKLKSPGFFEDLEGKWTSLQPIAFQGLRVVINQELNSKFKLMHTINLSTPSMGNYLFSAHVAPYENLPLIWCELDEAGVLKANIMHHVNPRIRVKAISHFGPTYIKMANIKINYCGDDFTATVLLSNFSFIRKCGLFSAQYLQSITNEFALGTQITLEIQEYTNWEKAAITISGRYALHDIVWTGLVSKHFAQFRLCRDINQNLKIGLQATTNLENFRVAGRICSEWVLPQNMSVFRGAFDSYWNVCGSIEQRLQQYPLIFTFSCGYNYIDNNVKVGASFTSY